jgi:uncharacterized protein YggU (UPF0235/DUF167 family)
MTISSQRVIQVRVKPGTRMSALEETSPGVWLAKLKAQPIEGKANAELIRLLAKHFGVSRSAVAIKAGASARTKLVRIGLT